jgi:hypothetical protein
MLPFFNHANSKVHGLFSSAWELLGQTRNMWAHCYEKDKVEKKCSFPASQKLNMHWKGNHDNWPIRLQGNHSNLPHERISSSKVFILQWIHDQSRVFLCERASQLCLFFSGGNWWMLAQWSPYQWSFLDWYPQGQTNTASTIKYKNKLQ